MGETLNLDKKWIDLASDDQMIFLGNDHLQIHKLRLFSKIKLFEVGTCL